MSFLGSAKHTLTIGVRVMSDEAVAGFRKSAAAAEALVSGQRANVRALEADLSRLRAKEEAASRNITAASREAAQWVEAHKIRNQELTREIEAQRRALSQINKQAPTGEAAYSKEYNAAVAYNKALDDRIAKAKEYGKVRAANAALEIENIRKEAAVASNKPAISAQVSALEKDRALIRRLNAEDKADAAAGRITAKHRTALESYTKKAAALGETKGEIAGVQSRIREFQRQATAGTTGHQLLVSGARSEEDNKRLYDDITVRKKAGLITQAQAKKEADTLRLSGVFKTEQAAKIYAAEARARILSENISLTGLEAKSKKQLTSLTEAKEKVKATAGPTGEAALRADRRIEATERMLTGGESLATLRAQERSRAVDAAARVEEIRNREAVKKANQVKAEAVLASRKQALPEQGMSEAAARNQRLAAAVQSEISAKVKERTENEQNAAALRVERDKEIAQKRALIDQTNKEKEAKKDALNKAREARDADIAKAAAARDAARALRQQLVGAIADSVTKIAMTLQFIKTVMAATRSAENFEFSARSVSALLGERRGKGEALYSQYFAKYGQTQGEVMPTAAVERMKQLAAAGYTKSGMVENTAAIFDVMLASAGELTEQSAADLGISLERAFGSLRMDMRTALDTAVKAANQFPMTVGNIRDALGYATEAAVQSGQSLEETLLVIGSIMPIAKTASKAGTITRNALLSLVKPESQQILSELGVRPVDAEGKRRPMMDVFLDLNDQLEEVAKGKASKFYNSPEFIASEKARAKAEGRKYEPRSLDKVFKNQLGLEREQLEFKLTGVRGGAIFAAINRMPETITEKLKGTSFEGMRAEDARAAFEFLRIGLSGAAGEAARLAGELRRTSKVLGESFDASLERFKIALGTAALPMKDAFLSVSKQILDYATSFLTPAPGVGKEYIPGASTGLNAVSTFAGIAATGFLAKQVFSFGKALYDAKALIGLGAKSLLPAATAGAATAGVLGGISTAFTSMLTFLTSPAGLIAAFGLAATSLFSLKTGIDTAYSSITDFSDYLDRQNKSRMQKEEKALGTVFEALGTGKLKYDEKTGNITGLTMSQYMDIVSAGPLAGTLLQGLVKGTIKPTDAGDVLFQARENTIKAQYQDPVEQRKQLEILAQDRKRFNEDAMPKLLTGLALSDFGGSGSDGKFTRNQVIYDFAARQMRAAENYFMYANQFPFGGPEVALNKNFMREQEANTMEEAKRKASLLENIDYKLKLSRVPALDRLQPVTAEEQFALRLEASGVKRKLQDSLAFGRVTPDMLEREAARNPEVKARLEEYDRVKRAPTLQRMDQLDANDVYQPAITKSSQYVDPLVAKALEYAGEGKDSILRNPELASKLMEFLTNGATETSLKNLINATNDLKLAPPPTEPPTMTLPNGESGR